MSPAPAALARAYRLTGYQVGDAEIRIGRRGPDLVIPGDPCAARHERGVGAAPAREINTLPRVRPTFQESKARALGISHREATLIGAWNPWSKRYPDGRNRRLHRRLLAETRRLTTLPAFGALGRWREDHLLVLGDPRPARRLAWCFGQRALVRLRRGQPARLVWLRP